MVLPNMATDPANLPPKTTDWKSRYADLVNEYDHLKSDHTREGTDWKKAISRLSQVIQECSPVDEATLQPLTRALSGDSSAESIATAVNDFCLQLPEFDNGLTGSETSNTGQSLTDYDPAQFEQILTNFCSHLQFDPATRQKILGTHQEDCSPAHQLNRLYEVVQSLSGQLAQQPFDPAISLLLIEMVQSLPKFPELDDQLEAATSRAQACDNLNNLLPALEQFAALADTVHQKIEQERQQSAEFLNSTWQRLTELIGFLDSTKSDREQQSKASNHLQQGIQTRIAALVTEADATQSLPALRAILGDSVEEIRQQVNSYVEEEVPRLRRAEEQCQQLGRQVAELKQETDTLRKSLEKKQQEASRDPLTGLANRRAFSRLLAQEQERWQRYGRPLSLIFLDIDWFKKINDQFGHKAGDAALISIARILRKSLRENDLLARFGGEEFVALLPDSEPGAAFEVAEKLRSAVMETNFRFQEQAVHITISCGVSTFAEGDTAEDVLHRADTALYQAKDMGRNQSKTG